MSDIRPSSKTRKRMTKMPARKSYAVGHGKPPEATRFKPGQSGNPKGRPKGKKNRREAPRHERLKSIILEEAYRREWPQAACRADEIRSDAIYAPDGITQKYSSRLIRRREAAQLTNTPTVAGQINPNITT